MSQLYVPLGLCFLECGCISSPSPFPGLTQASGHPGSRVRQGPRRAGPGLCAASLSPVDVCSVPFLSAAWRGAVPASARAGHCQGPRGQRCTSFPLHPSQRPHWSLPSPLISVLSSLLGRAARRLRMSRLPLAVAVGTWQSVHKVGRCFAPGCPVSKLLMVIPVCYLLPAARGGGFSLFLQADGDLHLALEVGAFRRRLNTAVSASYLEVFGAEGSGWGTPCHPEVQPHCGWPRPAQGHNLRGHP